MFAFFQNAQSYTITLSVSSEPDDRAGPRPRFDEAFEAKQVIVNIPNLLAVIHVFLL